MIRAIIDIKVKIYSPSRMLFERRLVNYGTTADDEVERSASQSMQNRSELHVWRCGVVINVLLRCTVVP